MCVGYSVQAAPSPLFFGGFGRFSLENVSLSTKVKLYALLVRYVRGYISEICGSGKNTLHSAKINCSFFPQKARFFKPFCVLCFHTKHKKYFTFQTKISNHFHLFPIHPNFFLTLWLSSQEIFVRNFYFSVTLSHAHNAQSFLSKNMCFSSRF